MDGDIYWIDVTWDDSYVEETGTERLTHKYFLIDDEMLYRTRQVSGDYELPVPECDTLKQNWYVVHGDYIEGYSPDEIDRRISAHLADRIIDVKFSDKASYESCVDGLFAARADGSAGLFELDSFRGKTATASYYTDEKAFTLIVEFDIS